MRNVVRITTNISKETAREFDVPAPVVYVLRDEEGINACVIGGDPESSAILATAGALRLLTRDELQSVVARESEAKTESGASGPNVKKLAEALVALLEERTPARLDGVEATLGEIPEEVERSLTDFDGARTVVFALLLDRNDRETRRRQLEAIRRSATDGENADDVQATERAARVEATARAFVGASFTTRATVVRLAIPALKLGTFEECERFRATADVLGNADGRIDLFEFALRHSAIRELDVWFGITPPPVARYGSFGCVNLSTRTAPTYLASRGAEGDEEAARRAFDVGVAALAELEPTAQNLERRRSEEITLEAFKTAVERIAQTTPRLKSNLPTCFFACVAADGRVIEKEAETFDAISLALGVSEPVWRSVADALAAGEKAAVDGE